MIYWMHSPFTSIWELYILLFGVIGIVFSFILSFGVYIFFAYVFASIGKKFGIGTFPQFLVPVWNIVLLCDCAKIERWVAAGVVLPLFFGLPGVGFLRSVASITAFAANVYLWGKLAERLGKNFWFWGIITPLLGWFPSLILAFDGSRSSGGAYNAGRSQGSGYIEL